MEGFPAATTKVLQFIEPNLPKSKLLNMCHIAARIGEVHSGSEHLQEAQVGARAAGGTAGA